MTGLICLTKTFALTALAACGLLMAGGQLDTGNPTRVSLENGTNAQAGPARGVNFSSDSDADASISPELISDQSACTDNCPAPCATVCADLQRSPLDGAVEVGVSLDAAVAPEQFCGCHSQGSSVAAETDAAIEVEAGTATVELGASTEAVFDAGLGGY